MPAGLVIVSALCLALHSLRSVWRRWNLWGVAKVWWRFFGVQRDASSSARSCVVQPWLESAVRAVLDQPRHPWGRRPASHQPHHARRIRRGQLFGQKQWRQENDHVHSLDAGWNACPRLDEAQMLSATHKPKVLRSNPKQVLSILQSWWRGLNLHYEKRTLQLSPFWQWPTTVGSFNTFF